MAVIDLRVRPPVGAFLDLLLYTDAARRDRITRMHGFEPAGSAQAKSMPLFLQEMDAAGVTTGVLPARFSDRLGAIGNDAVLEVMHAYPGRFVGLAAVDPSDRRKAMDAIDRAAVAGFKGINFEPGSYPRPMHVDAAPLYPLYGCCEDLGLPVVIMAGGSAGPDLGYTNPVQVDHVAADFPHLRVVVSHGGWPWVHGILHVAYRRANVFISADQYLANMPGMDDYIAAINGFLGERFLYGSSYPFLPIDKCLAWFRSLPIRAALMEGLLWRNASNVFGIEAPRRQTA
jgi:predicted TIM-barrel fold metal-dependent hydrolase